MPTPPRPAKLWTAAVTAAVLAVALSACVAEPEPGASPQATGGATATAAPSSSATPTPTAGAEDIALPSTCDSIYSTGMRATLDATTPPLNDPGVTMLSSQVVEALEVLDSGAPTIRCSWGTPSESGMSTNVTILDADQTQSVIAGLQNNGFACSDADGGTLCTFEQEQITQDDTLVKRGESHVFRGNGWVATSWLNVNPDGYTADVVATLWG
jgi:hypothetical protein